MKNVLRIVGYAFLLFGIIWIVSIMGGVFSHAQGFTSLNDLWGGFAFHAVCMIVAMACLGQASVVRRPIESTKSI